MERILVIAHAHPDFSLGGGEIAAYNLFKAYRQQSGVEEAWFFGRADRGRGASGQISLRRQNEYLWEQSIGDWLRMKGANREATLTWFADFIQQLRPTIVHLHHYVHLGLEIFRIIKQVAPSIRIFVTLHEYIAICKNNGQMVKTNGHLCFRETYDECASCFPDHSREDFWMRKQFFKRHFDLVEGFISPSEFLRQRYIEWGIPAERIVVIENGQSDEPQEPPRSIADGEMRSRFGYFGQITPFKGLNVVLKALSKMPRSNRRKVVLEVHGANLEWQPKEYQEEIKTLRDPLIKQGIVQWIGPYQPYELRTRMASVDWVIVPSIWWENSPMVIQEAYSVGRPVIGSDIGGMAEKIQNGKTGFHIPVGSISEWERIFIHASQTDVWTTCYSSIRSPLTHAQCAFLHFSLFSANR